MSIAWLTRLYELNEAGRFDEAAALSAGYVAKRPKDYALHLQRGRALLSLGELPDARTHLDEAVRHSKGLAAWPWFYRAALHARLGEREPLFEALELALQLDPSLAPRVEESPFFAAHWRSRKLRALLRAATPPRRPPPARSPSRASGRRRSS